MAKNRDLEGPIHKAILEYLRYRFPNAAIHHSPNETSLNGRDVARMIAKQKSLGMRTGWPDLEVITAGWPVMFFEVKSAKGTTSDKQKETGALLAANGAVWAVVRSVDEVKGVLDGLARNGLAGAVPVPVLGFVDPDGRVIK